MNRYLTPTLIGAILAAIVLVALGFLLWPPGLAVGTLLAILAGLLTIAIVVHIAYRRRFRPEWSLNPADADGWTESELTQWRNRRLIEREQHLELRELKLARQMRVLQFVSEDYLDVLDTEPSTEELGALVETDRKLIALIDLESQRTFDRILANRYATEQGVDSSLIFADLRSFVEQVARLYRPGAADPLLDTEIELIAKSLSSTALHMLIIVDGLPINLKSYNVATMYRLIRRGVSYYGTYKTFRPYVEHGLNVLQVARLALGVNPAAVGAAWAAGKLTTYGAKVLGERLLQRQALQLLTDFIRVVGFEAAMIYGGDFRHRDANWVLGAALVNLEVSRGSDLAGRNAALVKLCNLALRHEFDRTRLFHHLAKRKSVDIEHVSPRIIMTRKECEDTAQVLATHARETGLDTNDESVRQWRDSIESTLGIVLDLPSGPARPEPSRFTGLLNRLRGGK